MLPPSAQIDSPEGSRGLDSLRESRRIPRGGVNVARSSPLPIGGPIVTEAMWKSKASSANFPEVLRTHSGQPKVTLSVSI